MMTLAAFFFLTPGAVSEPVGQEFQIKAAWLVNFLKFVEWPQAGAAPEETLTIGIVGDDPFGDYFTPIEGQKIMGRALKIERYGKYKPGVDMASCDLLFIAASEKELIPAILEAMKKQAILTVGEETRFINQGGMINLVVDSDRVVFDVNQAAADAVGLRISSQLLGKAREVIQKKPIPLSKGSNE